MPSLHSSSERTYQLIEAGRELSKAVYVVMVNTSSGAKSMKVVKE